MDLWNFCPDIDPANIMANLPENQVTSLLSGQNDLSIKVRHYEITGDT
jgi:hypothetical protein